MKYLENIKSEFKGLVRFKEESFTNNRNSNSEINISNRIVFESLNGDLIGVGIYDPSKKEEDIFYTGFPVSFVESRILSENNGFMLIIADEHFYILNWNIFNPHFNKCNNPDAILKHIDKALKQIEDNKLRALKSKPKKIDKERYNIVKSILNALINANNNLIQTKSTQAELGPITRKELFENNELLFRLQSSLHPEINEKDIYDIVKEIKRVGYIIGYYENFDKLNDM